MKQLTTLFALLLLLGQTVWAQSGAGLKGSLKDSDNRPVDGVALSVDGQEAASSSNEEGYFELSGLSAGSHTLIFSKAGWNTYRLDVNLTEGTKDLGTIIMVQEGGIDMLSSEDLIPTVSLSDQDVSGGSGAGGSNVSGLLTSSRDVFYSTAAFAFSPLRFRIRGYDSEHSTVYINGLPMNSPENGFATWSLWGGLNDAMRNRSNTVGLAPTDYTFGGIGGATQIDMRASTQWKQLRVGLAASNRSYRVRPMFIYSTGLMPNGWAFSVSGSLRLAEQGQVDGTYYNAGSYYAAAEKRIGKKHAINLSIFGAPRARGKNAPVTAEMQEIAREANDDKGYFYNPYWGWQTQEDGSRVKRNSRYSYTHIPVIMLTHDWKITPSSKLTTSFGYQFGENGSTALNWYNASDPRPEYYRKWPSYFDNTDQATADALRAQYVANPEQLQLDWDNFYEVNRNSYDESISSTETRAKYIVEERRYDTKQFNFNSIYRNFLNENVTLNAGVNGQYYIGHNYKILNDLLGADYYVDVDQFALRDSAQNEDFYQNDLDNPNAELSEGDVFGYDYESHIQNVAAWGQGQFKYGQLELFGAAELSYTQFWREGNMRNGRFPDNSLGKGEVFSDFNYNFKAGATYKLDGRNFFFLNGSYGTKAPYFRNSYVSARTRDQIVPGLESKTIYGVEGGYLLKAPKAKARISGYYTAFQNEFYNRSFFSDNAFAADDGSLQSGYVNFVMDGINRRHMGLELAGEYEVLTGLKLRAVAAVGENIYTSRPNISIYLDNDPNTQVSSRTAYMKNAYVAGSPQIATSFAINYRSPKYWFVNLSFNYMARSFVDINPDRRTYEAVTYSADPTYQQQAVVPDSDQWNAILAQEELPAAFTVDLFAGKSLRLKTKKGKTYFLYFNLGVNNILNNRNMVSGGFEQLRYDFEEKDPEKFPTRYFYSYGINYFASITYRLPM